ncbi:MAG: tail fiber domain-containing protein [Psychroserpens sp.]|uniref:tail fiber domain-containing protein n=1 Tax=Psychroserpens sp. TaxID=2020870 RepID=UPI003C731642
MRKITISAALLLFVLFVNAQVGIGNTDPKAQLDISAGTIPSEKDGILIPRMAEFPSGVNADQDGMLVFITDSVLQNRGFYYYDHQSMSWVEINPTIQPYSASLDDAYNNGRFITADSGEIEIGGTDGIKIRGDVGTGKEIDAFVFASSLYFNPRKAAFRAGYAQTATFFENWGNDYVGLYSFAGGCATRALGESSTAFGYESLADGAYSFVAGESLNADGENALALGSFSSAEADNSMAIGHNTSATGVNSVAIGTEVKAPSFGETVIGQYNTIYTPESAISFEFEDRIFSIGAGANLFGSIFRRNAITIFKSGIININEQYNLPYYDGSIGQVMQTDGSGNVTFQDAVVDGTGTDDQNLTTPTLSGTTLNLNIEDGTGTSIDLATISGGSLDDAYNFGGIGNGNAISTITGSPVVIGGTGELEVQNDIFLGQFLYHLSDNDTFLNFTDNLTQINSGGYNFLEMDGTTSLPKLTINQDGEDLDVIIESEDNSNMMFCDASENLIRFGTGSTGSDAFNGSTIDGVTIEYVADFDNGSSSGTAVGIGSTELLFDLGSNEIIINADFCPRFNRGHDLGRSTTQFAWDDVFADDFVNVSDAREKKDINDLTYGLKEILKMRPVSYTLKEDRFKETKLGLIAQEALKLVPEAVKTHDYKILDEKFPENYTKVELTRMGMTYNSLIPVLIKATQEQQNQIEQLKQGVNQLAQENKQLNAQLSTYKNLEARLSALENN